MFNEEIMEYDYTTYSDLEYTYLEMEYNYYLYKLEKEQDKDYTIQYLDYLSEQ